MHHAAVVFSVIRDRTYRHLFTAQVLALVGTGLATVALGLLAYDLAGADAGVVLGTAFAIKMVAYVLVAPLATAWLARLPRRRVMVGADVVRGAVAVSLPFVDQVWQVYLLIFVMQAASATFTPTFQATIPQVLPREKDYTDALSLSRLAYDLESVLSPVLAAAALLLVSSDTLFFGTAAGFAASALLVASVVLPKPVPPEEEGTFAFRLTRGARLFVRTPGLRPVLAINLAVAAAGAFVLVQTVVIVQDTFGLAEGMVAVALAANGLGSMTTAFLLPRLLGRVTERAVMLPGTALLVLGVALFPLTLLLAGDAAGFAGLCGLWFLIGVGWSAAETPVGRLIRRHVAAGDHGAAFAAQFSLSHACWLLTYPLAGWLGAGGRLTTAAVTLAVVCLVAATTALATWPRESARYRGRTDQSEEVTL